MNRAFFLGASSDIASALAEFLLERSWKVEGTFRTPSERTDHLESRGAVLRCLDISDKRAIKSFLADRKIAENWNLLLLSPSLMEPINLFANCDWDDWENTFAVNSIRQFQVIHGLLNRRRRSGSPLVLLWTGPGTNGVAPRYSAIAAAKIAQVKMVELLAEEYQDVRFVIVGPGWVATKTHRQTLNAGERAGENLTETQERLKSGRVTSIGEIVSFFEWVLDAPTEVVSGRNFAIKADIWGLESLSFMLMNNSDAFKLRRAFNDWRPGQTSVKYDPPEYK